MWSRVLGVLCVVFAVGALAQVPKDNRYRVVFRAYAEEPNLQHFSISGQDKAFPVKPPIVTYTLFNLFKTDALYTVQPYPDTAALPAIGKWMLIKAFGGQPSYLLPPFNRQKNVGVETLLPAHWISLKNARGQYTIEPINYAFVVYKQTPKEAATRLNHVLADIGFPGLTSMNHSGGYCAYVGHELACQDVTETGAATTYSNRNFKEQNDHFRVFGSRRLNIKNKTAYLFVTSISEESGLESSLLSLTEAELEKRLAKMNQQNSIYYENYGHHFVSFANARNNMAVAFIQAGYATYYTTLGNILNTLGESTEDHDGQMYVTVIH